MVLCPQCGQPIPADDVNVLKDIAFCRACNHATPISSIVHGTAQRDAAFDAATPPTGTWLRDDGVETTIGATTRSPAAFFLVPFMLVWSGGSLGGIYGSQLASGQFNLSMSLVGIPFLIGSIIFWSLALMLICGKVEVRLRSGLGTVFVGVGSIGWSRRFNTADIATIREDWAGWSSNRKPRHAIILEGAGRISFGSMLNDSRRYFVVQSLRRVLNLPG